MNLYRWWKGLKARLFNNGTAAMRLYCADGQVLYEIYKECRTENDPVYNKEQSAQDFFKEVITGIFKKPEIARSSPIRISEIAEYFSDCWKRDGRYDLNLLPLCFFFASVWSIDFQDSKDPSNDSDYRTRRFAEALKWGGVENFEYERGPTYFSKGIESLFKLLSQELLRQYGERLFMPSEDFEYRGSHADGITLSHSIFRYGEIANIYTIFSDWKLYPGEDPATYGSLFKEIADKELDTAWRMSRQCVDDSDYLVNAIKELYCGWDGKPVPRYRGY